MKARELLEKEENKVISELVLAELASVIARREEIVSNIASKIGLSRDEVTLVILLYIIKRFILRYVSVENTTKLPLIGKAYKPIAIAIKLSTLTKLKTLDLLHIAYAKLMKDEGQTLQKIVTADKDFEKARNTLEKEIGIALHVL